MARFLPDSVIRAIHRDQVNKYGGSSLVRDEARLASALSMPKVSFGGTLLHGTIFEQAAAYGFHLCQNHPFIDGNKRTAGMVMLTFLKFNGIKPAASEDAYYETMMSVARSEMSKAHLTQWLQETQTAESE